ncbi:hypothetical protein HDU77_009958 [Chytriomyces hyalinus]|nr:hypothetical protein HDU77_009958 [Chytriomyces hyalinus]
MRTSLFAPLQLAATAFLLAQGIVASPILDRRATCAHGAWRCNDSGSALQQCSYNAAGSLDWIDISVCPSNTVCSLAVYGCVAGVPSKPSTTSAAKTTTSAAVVTTTSKPVATTGQPPVTTSQPPSSSVVPAPPLPAVKKVIYIDNTAGALTGANLAVPGYADNDYNIVIIGFWLDQGPWDSAVSWVNLEPAVRQSYINAYHSAGKRVLVAAFGAAEWPTSANVNPVDSANKLAAFVKQYGLDGADIDWEDNNSLQAGTGEAWLIAFQRQLRSLLPSPQYTITHAPQAPYFIGNTNIYPNGGYLAIDKAVGSTIDFYNIQFYNQGPSTRYDTCTTLLSVSGGDWPGTSVFEMSAKGIPLDKIVIGKPITSAGAANTGTMAVGDLAACLREAKGKGWHAGVFGWQFTLDPSGAWIKQLSGSL